MSRCVGFGPFPPSTYTCLSREYEWEPPLNSVVDSYLSSPLVRVSEKQRKLKTKCKRSSIPEVWTSTQFIDLCAPDGRLGEVQS